MLVVLVAQIGAGPFVDGLRLTSVPMLGVATAVTAISTVCCAWRWQLVAGTLGDRIPLTTAVAAVYRAQFLNATLPGGVLGDVDRALAHGRRTEALGRSARSVFWERALGQGVQVGITAAILVLLPSSWRPDGVLLVGAGLVCLLGSWLVVTTTRRSRLARAVRSLTSDLATVLRGARARRSIVLASLGAVTCHLLVFLLAARVAGVAASSTDVLPIAAVVLLAAAVPANVAGWGPREGVAAWAFATAGLGAATGVTTAVVYGVMALVATLPGAVVLLAARRVRVPAARRPPAPVLQEVARA